MTHKKLLNYITDMMEVFVGIIFAENVKINFSNFWKVYYCNKLFDKKIFRTFIDFCKINAKIFFFFVYRRTFEDKGIK